MPVQRISNETDSNAGATRRSSGRGVLRGVAWTGRRGSVMGAVLIAALLLSGCSSTPTPTNETQAPSTEGSTPTVSIETEAEAPAGDGMDSLTCDQIGAFVTAEFGDVQFDEDNSVSPIIACIWNGPSSPLISVIVQPNSRRGDTGSLDLCEEDAQLTTMHGELDPEDFSTYNGCMRVHPPHETTSTDLWVHAAEGTVQVSAVGAENARDRGVTLIRQILDAS